MKSVFDGWTKKCEHGVARPDGSYCVEGYLMQCGSSVDRYEILRRIGTWVQQHLDPPDVYVHKTHGRTMRPAVSSFQAAVWANNECKLDIEGFKMVDLLTQGYVPEETVVEEEVKAEEESAICK
jgi:hypothetical protein